MLNGPVVTCVHTADQEPGPENIDSADRATQDNDLSTGHTDPEDGGADNAKGHKETM